MQPTDNSPFQSVIGLGPLKAEYANRGRGRWVTLAFGLLCVLAAPVLVLLAAYLGYNAYNNFGVRRVDNAIIPPLCFAAGALALGVLILFSAWRNWSTAAALFENGLAYNNRQGVRQMRWDEVDAVWQNVTRHYTNGVYTGTTHVYTVKSADGQKIILNDSLGKNVETLGKEIQRNAANALFPRYWQSLQNGQRLQFGPLGLDREKLYAGTKEVRWDEIQAVKIDKGRISVKKDKGWFNWATATVPQIPNFYIFYELVGRFSKVE